MKKICTIVLGLLVSLLSPASHAEQTSHTISSVEDIMRDWAAKTNRGFLWQAGEDYAGIKLEIYIPDVRSNRNLENVLRAINDLIAPTGVEPLTFCLYPNMIVVRRVTQADCNKSI